MKHPLPDAALKGHIAVVGMTGGGKTFTTKGIVEHILAKDPAARVCVLDPIKSDWWGITSSASGKRPGLPFHILGGPRGHVPLHETTGKAIGELVGSGALPLSIIDMADFGPGGLQEFFNDFAPALLRKMRGVVHLVLEEAHEFAPKERAGFGGETMTVHYAKKLATAGRSKGVRIIAATQRTQQLHNSVLGSCQTVIAHQLTYPADIEPVSKWFKGHVDKEIFARFSDTLTSLPTGTGWMCSGQAKVAEMVHFPPIWTFDNSATPDGAAEIDVTTAPVDRDKLRQIMGDAAKEAEANDPAALKTEIARLKAELTKKPAAETVVDQKAIETATSEGWNSGYAAGVAAAFESGADNVREALRRLEETGKHFTGLRNYLTDLAKLLTDDAPAPPVPRPQTSPPQATRPVSISAPSRTSSAPITRITSTLPRAEHLSLTGPQRHLLAALAWWAATGHDEPRRPQVAAIAGWTADGSNLRNRLSELHTKGLVIYPRDGFVRLTAEGAAIAPAPDLGTNMIDGVRKVLTGPQLVLFNKLLELGGGPIDRDNLAAHVGWEPGGSNLRNRLSELKTREVVAYPTKGTVQISDWLQEG